MKTKIIIILSLILTACVIDGSKKGKAKDNAMPKIENTLIKSKDSLLTFDKFLDKFCRDSVFRYHRIIFPIIGYNSDAEMNKNNYKWEKSEWDFYSKIDCGYKKNKNIISKIIPSDSTMIWRLFIENSGYDVNYRFKLIEGKWYLNYYSYKNI